MEILPCLSIRVDYTPRYLQYISSVSDRVPLRLLIVKTLVIVLLLLHNNYF